MIKHTSRKQKCKHNFKKNITNKTQKKMKGGGKTKKDFLKAAEGWIDKGTYVLESTNMSMIIDNDSSLKDEDQYIPADFLIRFANYGQYKSVDKLYKFLYNYCDNRYKYKSFSMNCWQFVLLCLLESEYLTEQQIAILYLHYMNSPIKNKRIPDYFGRTYSDKGEPGDIILFKRKDGLGTIWHIGILTNTEEEKDLQKEKYLQP